MLPPSSCEPLPKNGNAQPTSRILKISNAMLHARSLCLGRMASSPTGHPTYSLPLSYTWVAPLLLPSARKHSYCLLVREHACYFLHWLLVTPSVLRPKQITKLCHEHHVYVIMHVNECVVNIFVTSDNQ